MLCEGDAPDGTATYDWGEGTFYLTPAEAKARGSLESQGRVSSGRAPGLHRSQVLFGGKLRAFAAKPSLCYTLSYARMDARKNETTHQAWTQRFGVHRKNRAGNTCKSTSASAAFV